ncbi:hypothetical protein HPC49_24145 [Pyxidicoccus fallax]|uniref:Uncharacterized protein n=1 Tax=Pyxidicoccus fallax TaxID=394095 RepID=A0A848LE79_9BACT|nr:hypothetical protein [Pyxidicoccus fallax]NMO17349.1 hypothetical protein [Pyxidicoccus fallax]NPC81307.1 hypothetical protein [Pyxidicoccus fallax]
MPDIDYTLYVFVAALVVLSLMAGFDTARKKKRRRQAWKALSSRHDWGFSERGNTLEVQGLFRGQQLSLLTERRRHRDEHAVATVLRLELSAMPPEPTVESEGLGDRFLKLFGHGDEEVGDEELDAALDMKRVTPETRALLRNPRVREQLLALHRTFKRFSIEAGLLEAEQRGIPDTVEALEALLAPALGLATALQEAVNGKREELGS